MPTVVSPGPVWHSHPGPPAGLVAWQAPVSTASVPRQVRAPESRLGALIPALSCVNGGAYAGQQHSQCWQDKWVGSRDPELRQNLDSDPDPVLPRTPLPAEDPAVGRDAGGGGVSEHQGGVSGALGGDSAVKGVCAGLLCNPPTPTFALSPPQRSEVSSLSPLLPLLGDQQPLGKVATAGRGALPRPPTLGPGCGAQRGLTPSVCSACARASGGLAGGRTDSR